MQVSIRCGRFHRKFGTEQKLPGLLPLLPLTKGGESRKTVEEMIQSLYAHVNEECMSEQVQGREYLSMDDAAATIGWNRATIYEWVKRLNMKTYKFIMHPST